MINSLSKLSSVVNKANSQSNIRFNSSLPITISVLEELPLDRYKLLLGNREFTTKSQKKLKKGTKYWGNFGESKEGIITISGLLQKPTFLQDESAFLDIDIDEFFKSMKVLKNPIRNFKNWILENLNSETIEKDIFTSLSTMLVALKYKTIHLPFKSNNKPILVQFQSNFQNSLEFYFAYENLGPLRGVLTKQNQSLFLSLDVLFEKSLYFLQKEFQKTPLDCVLQINKAIEPLFDIDKIVLDIKG